MKVDESSSEAEKSPKTLAKEKPNFEKLCEEKTAEYAEMLLGLQAEKRQRIAEYATRQSDLDRLQEEHKRDMERTQEARGECDWERKELEQ